MLWLVLCKIKNLRLCCLSVFACCEAFMFVIRKKKERTNHELDMIIVGVQWLMIASAKPEGCSSSTQHKCFT